MGQPQELEHSVLQASSLQYEMLLLTDSISKEDSCWELRLRCGESCFCARPANTGRFPPLNPFWVLSRAGSCLQLSQDNEHPCLLAALSLFLMAVNIKTPVVVENITLMCLRILQKLIKPPAPTSKKNKVLP